MTRLHPFRFFSLFFHGVGDDQLVDGLSAGSLAVLLGVAALLLGVALVAFERFDVH